MSFAAKVWACITHCHVTAAVVHHTLNVRTGADVGQALQPFLYSPQRRSRTHTPPTSGRSGLDGLDGRIAKASPMVARFSRGVICR